MCIPLPLSTQIHPGAYVFYDAQQTGLGSCHPSEVAAKVKHLGFVRGLLRCILQQFGFGGFCHTFFIAIS